MSDTTTPEPNQIPRRADILRWTGAERAIFHAASLVEELGAHPHLTQAVISLSAAREHVADFVDGNPVPMTATEVVNLESATRTLATGRCARQQGMFRCEYPEGHDGPHSLKMDLPQDIPSPWPQWVPTARLRVKYVGPGVIFQQLFQEVGNAHNVEWRQLPQVPENAPDDQP